MNWHTSTPPKDCEIFAYCYSYDEIGKYFCMLKWDESCKYFVDLQVDGSVCAEEPVPG